MHRPSNAAGLLPRLLSEFDDVARDAEAPDREYSKAIPDAVLVQPVWETDPLTARCRQVKFLQQSDRMLSIGIGCDKARLERMLAVDEVPTDEFDACSPTGLTLADTRARQRRPGLRRLPADWIALTRLRTP